METIWKGAIKLVYSELNPAAAPDYEHPENKMELSVKLIYRPVVTAEPVIVKQ